MKHNYTDFTTIYYLYNELDLFSKLEYEFALDEDSTLVESFENMSEGRDILPEISLSPKLSVIESILAYSRQNIWFFYQCDTFNLYLPNRNFLYFIQ